MGLLALKVLGTVAIFKREHRKAVRKDMSIVRGGCTPRELDACLKMVSDEWNEQVPKQMRTFLDNKRTSGTGTASNWNLRRNGG